MKQFCHIECDSRDIDLHYKNADQDGDGILVFREFVRLLAKINDPVELAKSGKGA